MTRGADFHAGLFGWAPAIILAGGVGLLAGVFVWLVDGRAVPPMLAVVAVLTVGCAVLAGFYVMGRVRSASRAQSPSLSQGESRGNVATPRFDQDRLAHFADASSDWFWETDADLRYTWFSAEVERVTGLKPEWHYGKTRIELGAPDPITPEWEAHVETLRAHRPFHDFVYYRPGPDGGKWLRASGVPYFDDNGKFQGYRGTGRDITDAVMARKSIERAQTMLRHAVEALNELFVLWGPDDRLVLCNKRFREVNALVAETTEPGTLFADHIRAALEAGLYPRAAGREEDWYRERLERHRTPSGPFELKRQDGRWLMIDEQKLPDGSTVTISLDITERKRQEEVVRESREAAEEANRAKSQFLANMSHEIRTPLNAIVGMSDALTSGILGAPVDGRQLEYLSMIHQSGEHLAEIVEDILDLSRIEAGTTKLDRVDLSVPDEIAATVALTGNSAEKAGVRINLDVAKDLPSIHADRRLFRQCLLNLVSNAIKFTDSGGTVTISAQVADGVLLIGVKDTGAGISQKDLKRVFEPFVQVADQHTRAHSGTGLGLPIAKSLIEQHGGQLTADSTLGGGSTFRIHMPMAPPD